MVRRDDVSLMSVFETYLKKYGVGVKGDSKSDTSKKKGKGETKKSGTKRDWTPYRFCSKDWLLAAVVCSCSRTHYDVGLFLAEEHVLFERNAGLKAALSFLLADACFNTGKMELHFKGPRNNVKPSLAGGYEPVVPEKICRFARQQGIRFANKWMIADEEGRRLYCALAGFSEELKGLLAARDIDPVRAAFLIHRNAWSRFGLELLVRNACNPKGLLMGGTKPEQWLSFKYNLLLMRIALMAERVQTLCEISGAGERTEVKCEWLDESTFRCVSAADIEIGDLFGNTSKIRAGDVITARLLPREQDEYDVLAKSDFGEADFQGVSLLAVTKDIDWTSPETRDLAQKACAQNNIVIVRVVDTVDELDSESLSRLNRCVTTRTPVEERAE